MRKNTLIKGAAILMAANLTTRFMGFYYRIYMSRAIGNEGMGLYQLIMPIYMLAWSITSSGLTTTVSKLTAEENAKREFGNTKRILYISMLISLTISLSLSCLLFISADFTAEYIVKDVRTAMPLRILSLCFPFMACGSCIRGSFMGMQKQLFPALSQVLEQAVRIIAIFALSSFFLPYGLEYACGAAVTGIVLGEFFSFMLVFIVVKYFQNENKEKRPSMSYSKALSVILAGAVPLTLARVTGSMLSAIENILIPQRLMLYGGTENALAEFGKLSGQVMPLIQLPSAFLMAISVTLVPALSETQATGSTKKTAYVINKSIRFTIIIGLGFALLFSAFPSEICNLIYAQSELGVLLMKLSVICPFLYMQITLTGRLNGVGSHSFIFRTNLISSVINLFFIYFIMPKAGIDAFVTGITISLIATVSLSLKEVCGTVKMSISIVKDFLTPALCAVISFVGIKWVTYSHNLSISGFAVYSILFSGFYLLLLTVFGVITKDDILLFIPDRIKKS